MKNYSYDLEKIKSDLTIDHIEQLVEEMGGEPIRKGSTLVCKTICHCGNSHKLYWYENTNLFHCYTGCAESTFDIFELVRKVMSREQPKAREDPNWNLPEAIDYIAKKFGFSENQNEQTFENSILKEDNKLFDNYDRIKDININTQEVELKEYDDIYLKHLPQVIIEPWVEDHISPKIMKYYGIKYNPKSCGIVIPHRDINGRLIGIRERTLIKENAELYGKYRPAYIGKTLFNHPLSFNLYGLYENKEHIKQLKTAFVFESEKSVLQYGTMFGQENNLAVAVCGSSFINYQAWLLINLGVEEIIICLDKQFQEPGDKEFEKLTRNLKNIHKKYGQFITISIMFDKWNLLGYKMSPTDANKEIFIKLYKRRINLYD